MIQIKSRINEFFKVEKSLMILVNNFSVFITPYLHKNSYSRNQKSPCSLRSLSPFSRGIKGDFFLLLRKCILRINLLNSFILDNKSGVLIFLLSVILFSSMSSLSKAQGFDWQTGGRMPYKIPVLFIGINAGLSDVSHKGDFNLEEDMIECCKFKDGTGSSSQFGLSAEYWHDGYTAVNTSLSYTTIKGSFTVRNSLPTRNGDFITDFGFNSTISYIEFEIGAKRRLFETHISIGAALKFDVLLSGKSEYTEQAVSDNVPFEKRTILTGQIQNLQTVVISPSVFAAYDASLAVGYYASPYLSASYSLNSIIEDEPWRRFSLSIGIRIFRNL